MALFNEVVGDAADEHKNDGAQERWCDNIRPGILVEERDDDEQEGCGTYTPLRTFYKNT